MTFLISDGPRVEHRSTAPTLGIRVVTPFRGMLAVRDQLLAELDAWLTARDLHTDGPFFLRLHRVDMSADMDIEVGVLGVDHPGDARVQPDAQPDGTYAVLAYRGSSLQANKTLLRWAEEQGLSFDASPDTGEWSGRFEFFRTDPRQEKRKTEWTVELAFRLDG